MAEHRLHKLDVLGLIPGDYQPFHFPLFSPQKHLSLPQCEARVLGNFSTWGTVTLKLINNNELEVFSEDTPRAVLCMV